MERTEMPQNCRAGMISHRGRFVSSWSVRVAAMAVGFVVTVSACGADGEENGDHAEADHGAETSQGKQDAAEIDMDSLPEATTYEEIPDAPKDPDPHADTDGDVLHPQHELAVHDAPDGKPIARLPVEQISSPTWVPVIDRHDDWAQVLLPARPNGSAGWIDTSDGAVESAQNDYSVQVDLDDFTMEILEGGEQLGEWTVGIGEPEHPTPTGRASIIASIDETVNDYSPIVLPLSSHSESHTTFGGGPGTVGIHTWPDHSFVGNANSDGCIRVTQDALDELVTLPLGTIINVV